MNAPSFTPAWFLRGPHAQTVWGRLSRPRRLVRLRREVIVTPDDDDLVLDHLDRHLDRDLDREGAPLHFVLLHGLEGSSHSVYVQGLLSVIGRHGFSATALNFRSCARDPRSVFRTLPNRRPRFYHSGETTDFDFVIRALAARAKGVPIVVIGASLGGNVLLKWLGEHPGQRLVSAAATLSVPYDLAAGSKYLERSGGRFYVGRFLATLKPKVTAMIRRFPETASLLDLDRVMRAKTFIEFDDAATGPLHGFRDAADYHAQSSSLFFVDRITAPTLCVSAEDDPFLPPSVLPRVAGAASPSVTMHVTKTGGHTGFVAGNVPWACTYWAEELVVRWLIERMGAAA